MALCPSTLCSNKGIRKITPNIPMDMVELTITDIVKIGFLNSPKSNSGSE
jgi:hypothetical protein